ncbi:MAG: PH domain-containing protein [Alphaproteobacteria bacterium]|nr:PH domain-containing protein [Alphaproteobacteria bacterium]
MAKLSNKKQLHLKDAKFIKPFFLWTERDQAPQNILKSMLLPDESVLQIGQLSLGIYWKSIMMLFISIIFMSLMLYVSLPFKLLLLFGVFLTLKLFIMFSVAYLTRCYLLLAATEKRIIIRTGIFNLDVAQMRYSKIESVEVFITLVGRLLGYSTVIVNGTGGRTLAIPYIINAAKFRSIISELLINHDDVDEHANAVA